MIENDRNEQTTATTSPGMVLKAAREAKKLNYLDVASKTCLSIQCIKDLENDDYSHIGARVYARGYLLTYARLLEVADDDILHAFTSVDYPVHETPVKDGAGRHPIPIYFQPNRIKWHLFRWSGILLVAALVVLVVMWWQGQKKHLYSSTDTAPSSMSVPVPTEKQGKIEPAQRTEQLLNMLPPVLPLQSQEKTKSPAAVAGPQQSSSTSKDSVSVKNQTVSNESTPKTDEAPVVHSKNKSRHAGSSKDPFSE